MAAMPTGRTKLTLLALALAGASFLAAPSPALADDADDLFAKGNAAFEVEKYEEALTSYQAAWKLAKSYELAAIMGQAEMRLGKYRDAAEHFAYSLEHFAADGDAELKKNTETSLVEVKKELATVRLKTTTPDVTITVDGAPLPAASLGKDLFLAQGSHVFEASAPGHRSTRRTMEVKGGEDESIFMNLTPGEDPGTKRSPIPAYVLAGVGVAGIAVGAALVATAEGKKGEALKLHDEIGSAAQCQLQSVKCKALREATAATDALGNGGVAAFVFGGLAGAAAGAYFLLPARKPAAGGGARAAVVPVFGPGTAGLVVNGAF